MTGTISEPTPSVAPWRLFAERTWVAVRRNRVDVLLALVVAAAGAIGAFIVQRRTGRVPWQENDFWFDFDTHRVGLQMTTRDKISSLNTNLHPGFILLTNIPLSLLVPLSDVQKLTVEVCFFSALWVAAFFVMLRLIGLARFDALLFTAIAGASATSIFLGPVPESYTAATAGLVLMLAVVAWDKQSRGHPAAYVVAAVFAMGVTLINGILVAIAIGVRFWWRQAVTLLLITGVALVALSGLQHLVFSDSRFIVSSSSETNVVSESLLTEQAGGPVRVTASFLFHGVVAPDLDIKDKEGTGEILLTFQDSLPGSGTALGAIAAILWIGLLAVGVWALVSQPIAARNFRLVLGIALVATLLFLFVFGQDTFTFSPFSTPLLVAAASLGTLTRYRRPVLAVGVVLLVTELVNNVVQLDDAVDLLKVLRSAAAFV